MKFPLEFTETEAVKLRLDLINAIEALYTDDRATVSLPIGKLDFSHVF